MRVLVTRPAGDGEITSAALVAAGHVPIPAPVLAVRPVPADLDPRDWRGIVATSRHAVRAIFRRTDVADWLDLPILCVGEATATAARNAGFRTVVEGGGDVATLVETMVPEDWPAPLLYPCGEVVSIDLPAALAKRGVTVERRVVYAADVLPTLSPEAEIALLGRAVDGAVFYSPRSVKGFAAQVRAARLEARLGGLTAWCMSDAIATAAKAAGFGHIRVAAEKTGESLIATIAAPQ